MICNLEVAGSIPVGGFSEGSVSYSRVTQLVEWVAVNHHVAGSSPAAGVSSICRGGGIGIHDGLKIR
jgi:hypothetical protein